MPLGVSSRAVGSNGDDPVYAYPFRCFKNVDGRDVVFATASAIVIVGTGTVAVISLKAAVGALATPVLAQLAVSAGGAATVTVKLGQGIMHTVSRGTDWTRFSPAQLDGIRTALVGLQTQLSSNFSALDHAGRSLNVTQFTEHWATIQGIINGMPR